MSSVPLRVLIVIAILSLSREPVWAQTAANTAGIFARDRYSGLLIAQRVAGRNRPAAVPQAAGAGLDVPVVHYQEISLRPGTRVAGSTAAPLAAGAGSSLPLKATGGFLIYELRAGKLTTTINGNRRERGLGEFWIVGPTDTVTLETEDDSVVLRTIQLAN
ncbi:hypothetical protein [Bradyrhizobium sp. CCBAU 65884]|uniref:hypothetical protein n=1 Tax=Bradyrhizobium sp. CCBAU 65884 TaxID=722477 RepID=UPI0023061DB4|nr:hypothetical protein [Bradyrhizobium sp. CCBAU 65884]